MRFQHTAIPRHDQPNPASSSLAAFTFAVVGAGVASRLVFDHQLPSQPEDVVTYLATLGAAVIVGWWLANVLAWTVALRQGVQLQRFTLPGTKRIAQIMLAVTLTTSCVADAGSDPVMVLVEQADATPPTSVPIETTMPPTTMPPTTTAPSTTTTTETTPDVTPVETSPEPVEAITSEASTAGSIEDHQIIVNEGDNLWLLAAETLTLHGIDEPSCGQIAEYWRLVVAANQVRSANPDLIVPGEAITMPAFDLSPSAQSSLQPAGIGAR